MRASRTGSPERRFRPPRDLEAARPVGDRAFPPVCLLDALAGPDTFPVLLATTTCGRAHTLGPDEDPLIFEYSACGHDFDGIVACSHCGQPVHREDVSCRRGPGHPDYCAPSDAA